jgi:hypothetical protein
MRNFLLIEAEEVGDVVDQRKGQDKEKNPFFDIGQNQDEGKKKDGNQSDLINGGQGNIDVIEQTERYQIEHRQKGIKGVELYLVFYKVNHFLAWQLLQ